MILNRVEILVFWRPLALERGKRGRNIRCLCLMGRWTNFVDKHEEDEKISI